MEEVVAEGVSVPLPVLELPEPQLGEEGAAPAGGNRPSSGNRPGLRST